MSKNKKEETTNIRYKITLPAYIVYPSGQKTNTKYSHVLADSFAGNKSRNPAKVMYWANLLVKQDYVELDKPDFEMFKKEYEALPLANLVSSYIKEQVDKAQEEHDKNTQ